jgi:hypothetical protein
MSKTLAAMAVATLFVTACASTPAPAPKVAEPNFTSNAVVSKIPAWFLKQPESTATTIYVVGTSKSADLSMVEHKAVIDAQSKLAYKLAGEVDSMAKDYKREAGEEFSQTTEQATRRTATGVKVAGYTIVDRVLYPEGNGFRSYILLKYPVVAREVVAAPVSPEVALNEELNEAKAAKAAPKMASVKVGRVPDNSGIVIRETLASPDSKPLGMADAAEEN